MAVIIVSFLHYMIKKDLVDKQKLVVEESRGLCLKTVPNEQESVVVWPDENLYSTSGDFEKEHSLPEFQLCIYYDYLFGSMKHI